MQPSLIQASLCQFFSLQSHLPNMDDTTKKHSIEHFEIAPGPDSDTGHFIDPIAEKKLLRKVDLRILPPYVSSTA